MDNKKQITEKIYLTAKKIYGGKYHYHMFTSDMSSHGYIPIASQDVTMDIPDHGDLTEKEIDLLSREKQKILVEAQAKAANIDEQIQRLQAITYQPEAEQ